MNPTQNPIALRSKKIIAEVLLRLMTQYPYAEITVKHILLEAGISRKTFYRNFSSKDDVLDAYIEAILPIKEIIWSISCFLNILYLLILAVYGISL